MIRLPKGLEADFRQELYAYEEQRRIKGIVLVVTPDGSQQRAEIHWYEAHGIGKVKMTDENPHLPSVASRRIAG